MPETNRPEGNQTPEVPALPPGVVMMTREEVNATPARLMLWLLMFMGFGYFVLKHFPNPDAIWIVAPAAYALLIVAMVGMNVIRRRVWHWQLVMPLIAATLLTGMLTAFSGLIVYEEVRSASFVQEFAVKDFDVFATSGKGVVTTAQLRDAQQVQLHSESDLRNLQIANNAVSNVQGDEALKSSAVQSLNALRDSATARLRPADQYRRILDASFAVCDVGTRVNDTCEATRAQLLTTVSVRETASPIWVKVLRKLKFLPLT